MSYLIIHHKVEDYAKWYPFFTQGSEMRKAAGSKGGRIFRSKIDPNEIVTLFEWDSIENAQKFSRSPELAEVMKTAGVIGMPEAFFMDEAGKVSA
jgi:heme-degrading monooxygenase HmoA